MGTPPSSSFNHTAASSLPELFALWPHIRTTFPLAPPFDDGAGGRPPRYPKGEGGELLCSGDDSMGETPQVSGAGGGGSSSGGGGLGDARGGSI